MCSRNTSLNTSNSHEIIINCYLLKWVFRKKNNCFFFFFSPLASSRLACFCISQETITLLVCFFQKMVFDSKFLLPVSEGCTCLFSLLVLIIKIDIWLIMYLYLLINNSFILLPKYNCLIVCSISVFSSLSHSFSTFMLTRFMHMLSGKHINNYHKVFFSRMLIR